MTVNEGRKLGSKYSLQQGVSILLSNRDFILITGINIDKTSNNVSNFFYYFNPRIVVLTVYYSRVIHN